MPFLAAIPLTTALLGSAGIAAGGSIASGLIGSHAANSARRAAENSPLTQEQIALIRQQAGYGRESAGFGRDFLQRYGEGTSYLSDFYRKLLGDDNSEALKALSPLVRARKQQTATNLNLLDFAPRGGGRGAELYKLRDDESGDIFSLLQNERNAGRRSYTDLITNQGSLGTNLLSSASGSTGSAASLLGGISDRIQNAGQQASSNAAQTAGSLGSSFALLLQLMRSYQDTRTPTSTASIPIYN